MALPKGIKKEHLDDGIADLVINMNRIYGFDTKTTCEGHVWKDTPAWPSKNGWIHFYAEKGTHKDLIDSIKDFCEKNKNFAIDSESRIGKDKYCINALFEDHTCFDYFSNPEELAKYFDRADMEKKRILNGWNELNKIIVEYIKKNLSPCINNLSYRKR